MAARRAPWVLLGQFQPREFLQADPSQSQRIGGILRVAFASGCCSDIEGQAHGVQDVRVERLGKCQGRSLRTPTSITQERPHDPVAAPGGQTSREEWVFLRTLRPDF